MNMLNRLITLYSGGTAVVRFAPIVLLLSLFGCGGSASQNIVVLSRAATPTFSPSGGSYTGTQTVTITSSTPGAIICWNTTGAPATNGLGTGCTTSTSLKNGGSITVSTSETVYAVAGTSTLSDSSVGSAAYTITSAIGHAATPTFSPGAGTYTGTQTVTLTSATSGAQICWNVTGSPATNGLGTGCTTGDAIANGGSVRVLTSETVYAVAGTANLSDSPVASAAYTINFTTNFTTTIAAVDAPVASGANNYAAFEEIIATPNPLLTEQEISINAGTTTGGNGEIYLDTESGTGVCSPTIDYTSAPYNAGGLDGIVAQYKTSFLFQVASEGDISNVTNYCVWSQAHANASALTWTASTAYIPGEYINVDGTFWQLQAGCYSGSGYSNTCTTGASEPNTCFGTAGPCTDGTVSWVKIGANAPVQDGFCGSAHACISSGDSSSCYAKNGNAAIVINANSLGPCTLAELYQAEPIGYELPVRNWEFQIMSSFISHYNGNSNVDYMRAGSPAGGEFSVAGDLVPVAPWGNGATNKAQFRAQWISWVNKFDAQIMSYSPTFRIISDMNCVGNPEDCSYADQEALAAYNNGLQGIGNQDYNINDMNNLGLTGTTGSHPCAFNSGNANPLVANSGCTQGDWAYNFAQFPSMAHQLQSYSSGTTPEYCPVPSADSAAGPIAGLPSGSPYCSTGTPGLLPSLTKLCNTGTGSPNVKICVNILEMHTGFSSAADPIWTTPVSDTLLALSADYGSTVGAIPDYVLFHAAYAEAFCTYLGLSDCATTY
jgi:hypothetical protein